jgi:type IV pilus assembly protein PilV
MVKIRQSQRGISLIEILITVLVVSIGLLGLASLQLKSMALSNDSNKRQQAINLAHDISDRIFVNGAGASAGSYTIALGTSNAVAVDVASSDLVRWQSVAGLFTGDFSINDPAVSSNYTITVCWQDNNENNPNPRCNNQTQTSAFQMQASRR